MDCKSSSQGFSILELLTGVALVSLIIGGGASVMIQFMKESENVKGRAGKENDRILLRQRLQKLVQTTLNGNVHIGKNGTASQFGLLCTTNPGTDSSCYPSFGKAGGILISQNSAIAGTETESSAADDKIVPESSGSFDVLLLLTKDPSFQHASVLASAASDGVYPIDCISTTGATFAVSNRPELNPGAQLALLTPSGATLMRYTGPGAVNGTSAMSVDWSNQGSYHWASRFMGDCYFPLNVVEPGSVIIPFNPVIIGKEASSGKLIIARIESSGSGNFKYKVLYRSKDTATSVRIRDLVDSPLNSIPSLISAETASGTISTVMTQSSPLLLKVELTGDPGSKMEIRL